MNIHAFHDYVQILFEMFSLLFSESGREIHVGPYEKPYLQRNGSKKVYKILPV
jgi:hypothetical protein